uniref:Uma2 family endonuclease n=1 Tax=Petrachloros mirabilis TaxID=2918835 RepID=UPI0023AB1045|nr:Uma2 family endonuclease [Petrachloros mirabilis]
MIQSKQRFLSFDEYLAYDDDSDRLYELFNGELMEVPPESGENVQIANRLFLQFGLLLGIDCVRGHGLELEVLGEPKNRYPDLTIISSGAYSAAKATQYDPMLDGTPTISRGGREAGRITTTARLY